MPFENQLTPPSYEYKEGIYVFLSKHRRDSAPSQLALIPAKLKHILVSRTPCRWKLRGRVQVDDGAMTLQRRYASPVLDGEAHQYPSCFRANMWTMLGTDGKEDTTFRILQVYYSTQRAYLSGKRAANSGTIMTQESSVVIQESSKRQRTENALMERSLQPQPEPAVVSSCNTVSGMPAPRVARNHQPQPEPPVVSSSPDIASGISAHRPIKTESDDENNIGHQQNCKYLEDCTSQEIAALVVQKGPRFQAFANELKENDIHGRCLGILLDKGKKTFSKFLNEAGLQGSLSRMSFYADMKAIPRRTST